MKLLILTALVVAVAYGHGDHHKYDKHKKEDTPLSSQFNTHLQAFVKEFAGLQSRPTGRPDFGDLLKSVEKKYKEAKENLKAASSGKHYKYDDEYERAYHQLKKQKYEIKHKVEEWKWQMEEEQKKQKEAERKQKEAMRKAVIDALVKDFDPLNDDLFKTRPTGRPEFEDLFEKIEKKYKEAQENLKAHGKTDKHGKHYHDKHYHDKDLKEAFEELYKKNKEVKKVVDGWRKQAREDRLKAFLAASPFGAVLDAFKVDFDSKFAGRPTGRPDVHKFMKELEKQYKEAKENLHSLRPTGRPYSKEHRVFKHADKQLKNTYYDAWEKVEAWKKQVDATKHKKHHDKHHYHHKH